MLGWLNTKQFLKTGDAAASQGWTAFVLLWAILYGVINAQNLAERRVA